jgi:hypothetical protein
MNVPVCISLPGCLLRTLYADGRQSEKQVSVLEWKHHHALVFSLHRKWKLWVWPCSIVPVNRQERSRDNLEFHFTQFSKVYTLICICFHVILWYCVNMLNMTGNEACILPCEGHMKKLYSIVQGFPTSLLYMNWAINEQNIWFWATEHSCHIAEWGSYGEIVCVPVALSSHVIIETVCFDNTKLWLFFGHAVQQLHAVTYGC